MPDAVAVDAPHARKGSLLMKLVLILALAALAIVLVQRVAFSFMAQRPADYAGTTPAFDVRTNLGGPMVSEGVIYGPTGRVTTRFVADMNGVWDDDGTATLGESFRYASGGTQEREWRITMRPDGNFTATADDIIGEAVGELSGATLRMRYRIRLPESARRLGDGRDRLALPGRGRGHPEPLAVPPLRDQARRAGRDDPPGRRSEASPGRARQDRQASDPYGESHSC